MSVSVAPAASKRVWRADAFQPRRGLRASRPELMLATLTLGRLSLVPVIMLSFMGRPFLAASALILFIAVDICDGVLARIYSADGPRRRALDSLVDRVAIDACMISACVIGELPVLLLLGLLARDAYCAAICTRMVYKQNVVIKADWLYRALNLCVAAGGIVGPLLSRSLWVSLAGVLLILSIGVAVDLTRSVRLVETSNVRDTVLGAGALRRRAID
jgi:phosphatidylglycerophosphate synthase